MHYSAEWKENRSILEMSSRLLDKKKYIQKEKINIVSCFQDNFYQWNYRKLSDSSSLPPPHNECMYLSGTDLEDL